MSDRKTKSPTFFGFIANYENSNSYFKELEDKDSDDLYRELVNEIYILSKNTKKKHILVNISWLFLSLSFLISIVLFTIHVIF